MTPSKKDRKGGRTRRSGGAALSLGFIWAVFAFEYLASNEETNKQTKTQAGSAEDERTHYKIVSVPLLFQK